MIVVGTVVVVRSKGRPRRIVQRVTRLAIVDGEIGIATLGYKAPLTRIVDFSPSTVGSGNVAAGLSKELP